MRITILLTGFCLLILSARAQFSKNFLPGHYRDTKGNLVAGLIQSAPSGRGPLKNQGFIAFKTDEKADKITLAASELEYFVTGRDSFVVAPAPMNANWSKYELDFVKVEVDEPIKIYALKAGSSGGFGVQPSVGLGVGGGSYGFGGGGGIGLTFGPRGGGSRLTYYVGPSTGELTQVTRDNFTDVMSDVMADAPQVLDQLQNGRFSLSNINALFTYYRYVKAQQAKGHY